MDTGSGMDFGTLCALNLPSPGSQAPRLELTAPVIESSTTRRVESAPSRLMSRCTKCWP